MTGGLVAMGMPEWLAKRLPAEVDAAAVLRASQHGARLSERKKWVGLYDNGASVGGHAVSLGFEADGPESARAAALADLSKLMAPAPSAQIEAWLAELSVIAPKRAGDEFEEALRLTAYARRLEAFPADVVRYALLERPWRFWPSWAELDAACGEAVSRRKAMLEALARRERESVRPERREPVSAERASDIVREIFGDALAGGGCT